MKKLLLKVLLFAVLVLCNFSCKYDFNLEKNYYLTVNKGINADKITDITRSSEAKYKQVINLSVKFSDGYKLGKWNTTGGVLVDSNNEATSIIMTEKEVTVTADAVPIDYVIAFNANGGSGSVPSIHAKYDTEYILPENTFTKQGYGFLCWNTAPDGSGVSVGEMERVRNLSITDGNTITLYAVWELGKYTVKFNYNKPVNGSTTALNNAEMTENTVLSKTVVSGAKYGELPSPNLTGWKFDGWFTSETGGDEVKANTDVEIMDNQVLYAHWSEVVYTLTLNNGTNEDKINSLTANKYSGKYGEIVNINAELAAGYKVLWECSFGGKFDSVTSTSAIFVMPAEDAFVISHAIVAEYSIKYELNGGRDEEGNNPLSYTINSPDIILDPPSRKGYDFTGWTSTDLDSIQSNVTIPSGSTGDRTYTANWMLINYNITYHLNGGTNSSSNPNLYTIEDEVILSMPTREGFEFVGWTGSNGSIEQRNVIIPSGSKEDKEFIANWQALFSVSSNKKVYFSKGNLYYNGSSWEFETNQYDLRTWSGENAVINGERTVTPEGDVGLFYWSKDTDKAIAEVYVSTGRTDSDPFFANTDSSVIGSEWACLTENEWDYLLHMRTNGNKSGFAKINIEDTEVTGVILLPDLWVLPAECSFISGNNYADNSYTLAQWEKMEKNGAVFLPSTGYRSGSNVNSDYINNGYYWTSTPYSSDSGMGINFHNNSDLSLYHYNRGSGRAVRLVRQSQN